MNLIVEQALDEADMTLDDIGLVAATQGPGLVGALLVGLSTAKALAAARELPFAPVDHLQGHVAANFLVSPSPMSRRSLPSLRAAVPVPDRQRRAHAACARAASTTASRCSAARSTTRPARRSTRGRGCSGWAIPAARRSSGSPPTAIPRRSPSRARAASAPAADGGRAARPLRGASTSPSPGLKTALLYRLRELSEAEVSARAADLAASYQAAIVDSLILRAEQALERTGLERLAVGGGVAANGELRRRLGELGATLHVPARVLCTDNAAMIASAARFTRAAALPASTWRSTRYATGSKRAVATWSRSTPSPTATCATTPRRAARLQAELGFELEERDISATTLCSAPTSSVSRSLRWTARSCSSTSSRSRCCVND